VSIKLAEGEKTILLSDAAGRLVVCRQFLLKGGHGTLALGAVWLFVFVIFRFCVFGVVLESVRGVLTES